VVSDRGRGVQSSLSEVLPGIDPSDALAKALEPGVSRQPHDQNRGNWENTGFGLFVLSKLAKNKGVFTLWSSGYFLELQLEEASEYSAPLAGSINVIGARARAWIPCPRLNDYESSDLLVCR